MAFISVAARVLLKDYGLEDRGAKADDWIKNIARLWQIKAREALQ